MDQDSGRAAQSARGQQQEEEGCTEQEMNRHLIEQLLTCSVCLDRYTKPKLLPCQHTFCQEPCLSSLADRADKKVKCPECRTVHRIPQEGVAGFPNNRTILGFLEIPMEQISSLTTHKTLACAACGLKEELAMCHHCQQKLCHSCNSVHREQLRLDLRGLVCQLRRSLPKLSAVLGVLEQKAASLQENGELVRAEISHSVECLIAELREREQVLILQSERLVHSALRDLQRRQEDLEVGLATVSSHCDCVDSSLADDLNLPGTILWQLHKQSKELINHVRELEKPGEEPPEALRFAPGTVLYSNVVNFGSVFWATKDAIPSQLLSSDLSRRLGVHSSFPSISSMPTSIEVCSPMSISNLSSILARPATKVLTPRTQARQRLNTPDSQSLVIELLDTGNHLLGFRLKGQDLLLHYQEKGSMKCKIGSKGSDLGYFTWPRGVAVTPEGHLVVADSSNHRVQIFDRRGHFVRSFGSYGSGEGEFDCLAGVAVSDRGWIVTADRYNHRLQLFDSRGRFVRLFGREGACQGHLSYPWGVAVDRSGLIYVCDKDNHRLQLFSLDGHFVRAFGCHGNATGQLDQPHYVAVGPGNQVVVSDSGNHRLQVFDGAGGFVRSFGCEGTGLGQLKYPRGVAVDHDGNILVGDSGNNRVQLFRPDGTFLQAFGSWGTGDGQLKGLEGVAFRGGDIVVSDRENHRIQVF